MRSAVRPVASPRLERLVAAWERLPPVARGLGVGGLLLAFGLLIGFYIVVAGAVHRAERGRQEARAALDRQAACAAFTQSQSRELCAVTVASPAQDAVTHALYEPSARARRGQVTARVY
jgi:type II secretory pathway component PulM